MKALRATLILIVLILLLPSLLYTAVSTELGSRAVLRLADHLLPLEIDYGGGSLGGRLVLDGLLFQTDSVRIEVNDAVVELSPDCLWRAAICFDRLQVGQLDIDVLPLSTDVSHPPTPNADDQGAALIKFPVPIEADSLDVKKLRVRWPGGAWQQGSLLARVHLYRSTVQLDSVRIVDSQLTLRDTSNAPIASVAATQLPSIDLPLNLSVEDLQLINPAWDFYGEIQRQENVALTGSWVHTDLNVKKLELRSGELGELSLRGNLAFTGDWPIQAEAEVTLAESLQYSPLLGSAVKIALRENFKSLGIQISSAGTVDLSLDGHVNVLEVGLPFAATLTATSASMLAVTKIEGAPQALDNLNVEFPLVMAVTGSLQAQEFEFSGAISGMGYNALDIHMVGLHEQGRLVVSDVSFEDAQAANMLHGKGEMLLSEQYPWSFALHSSGLDLPGITDALRGRIDGGIKLAGKAQGELWEVRAEEVQLQGVVNDMPARIEGFAGINSDLKLLNTDLGAQLNGAELSLQSAGDEIGPGQLHLTIGDIGRWYTGGRGSLQLSAVVAPGLDRVEWEGRLQSFDGSGLRFDNGTVTGDYNASAAHAFHVATNLREVVIAGVEFSALDFLAMGDEQKQTVTVNSRGDVEGEINVTGTLQGDQWLGSLAPTRLQTSTGDWVLAESVAISASPAQEQLSMAAHCWEHPHARLCSGDWALGSQGSGSIELDADLAIIADLLPPNIAVIGDMRIQLDGGWAPDTAPRVAGTVQTGAVELTQQLPEGESATFGWGKADATIDYSSAGLQLDVGVQRDSRQVVGLELLLPLDRKDAMVGAIAIDQLQLGAVSSFVPALSTLRGVFDAQLSLSGTVDEWQAFGEVSLAEGHLRLEGNPTELEKLNLNLDVQGDLASIRGDGLLGGGELKFAGEINTKPELQMDLTINGTDNRILYPPSTELQVSESLLITLNKDLLILTGEVTVQDGVLQIEELPEGSVARSPYVVEVDTDGKVISGGQPLDIRMDVKLHIADGFRIAGETVQTQLGGDLRVQQRSGQPPQVFGNLSTLGGEFRAYQTRLQIKRGSLDFTGPPANPMLDVRAERNISRGDVIVGVQLQGPLQDDLQLEVYSTPTMSQTEAMSYLVRGRGLDSGAGIDGTAAALSLASGVVNRSELVTELNRIPGLSGIEFGAQGSEDDTAATVSGYLGERIYLSYGIGLYEPVNVLTTRLYLRSRFWLEVVSSLENSVDLYYSFDIE